MTCLLLTHSKDADGFPFGPFTIFSAYAHRIFHTISHGERLITDYLISLEALRDKLGAEERIEKGEARYFLDKIG